MLPYRLEKKKIFLVKKKNQKLLRIQSYTKAEIKGNFFNQNKAATNVSHEMYLMLVRNATVLLIFMIFMNLEKY